MRRQNNLPRPKNFKPYTAPSGGWGSARSVANILRREGNPASGALTLTRQNKVDGFQCVSCAWIKPAKPLPFEFCENGVKATAWEITSRRCTPAFFAEHTVTELLDWDDYHLEQEGRLTHPMRYDAATDKYVPVSWGDAVADIGRQLHDIEDRENVVFYSSGRSSNEASYMYGLFARLYGNNNLPDSSNMCHETTSVALPESIGVPVGTVTLDDFATTECILSFGQNAGSNSPRILHPLQEASRRGVPIITYNPLRERGLESFTNPQSVTEMVAHEATPISSSYNQVRTGGDLAALTGICKALLELDHKAIQDHRPSLLDRDFIASHTHGFDRLSAWLRKQDWQAIERISGLPRAALTATAVTYAHSNSTIAIYGMGLTQHRAGVETVQMLVNLLLLRGNIGKQGAGICPVRGHSNVQGQRTVGITEKPELVPLDRLAQQYGFEPPRTKGLDTVEACEEILKGKIRAFIMLGGNFARAVPDRPRMEKAWRDMPLTVNIATKLNRSQLLPGATSYILPVLGRIEIDKTECGPQALSMEDTSGCIHGSRGVRLPASRHLISEVRLVGEIAKATLDPNPKVSWDDWIADYSLVRRAIAETYPDTFSDYEDRMWEPGGFQRPLPARHRGWHTKNGKANLMTPTSKSLGEDRDLPSNGEDVFHLMTLRSNDQFNTTVYGYTDRFRGIHGTRDIVFMNTVDIERLSLSSGDRIELQTVSRDGIERRHGGLSIIPYDIPVGCIGAYYPEANVLLPMGHYAIGSKTPAAKSIPVTIRRDMIS
ncbi:FdhF/YdeP family oxidoreductase [Tanticharoenia sakaeratensis]|uniref:Molybdopterin oxidoreductase family protein n=1 Tax=Tanticharoenia sakaeratensis NBRC 103193 TaxID=1231623 RepID=A0A0D6MPT4_9PROT|nr:FdhF/YdeP family oxidoreductase [Tanticharoenia sakaeratensis]GAN55390.1 molybdopterin oxidoreductase family protein [Tanticharoenia sakaeratensis NBRC 103193]GBQ22208.1 molybdopterin oxidoreductase family protein [Tanticharoenia sakaeratensis NBRC 103193]